MGDGVEGGCGRARKGGGGGGAGGTEGWRGENECGRLVLEAWLGGGLIPWRRLGRCMERSSRGGTNDLLRS